MSLCPQKKRCNAITAKNSHSFHAFLCSKQRKKKFKGYIQHYDKFLKAEITHG